jgi:hypothetical protein
MSFSELVALTTDLSAREVVGQVPSPPSGFASRLEAVEDGLKDVKTQQGQILDQQQQLLDAVTALARHVVHSPLARATSDFELTGSPVMVPSAVPPVSQPNTPVNSFHICSAQAASPDNFVARTLSCEELPPPPVAPPGVECAQQFSIQLTPKEALASLQSFSGSSDKTSEILDNDTFIEFQDWFSASLWKLSVAGVSAEVHPALLAQKLFGPIQKLFIRELEIAPVNLATLSVNDLRSPLSGLYPDASIRFSDAILAMVSHKEHLARDIAKFRIYALHSNFASTLDRNEWIYALLRRKMHAAWPQCLLLAATKFQLTLDPALGISPYVDQALKISARLQSQSTLSSDLSRSFSLKSKVSFQVPHKRAAPPVDNRVASPADEAGPSQPFPKLATLEDSPT